MIVCGNIYYFVDITGIILVVFISPNSLILIYLKTAENNILDSLQDSNKFTLYITCMCIYT